jgi:hypothetical protein
MTMVRKRGHFLLLSPLRILIVPRKYYDLLDDLPNLLEADLKKAYRKK